MNMKPQDIVVVLKLLVTYGRHVPYADLAKELHLSTSEVHAAIQRSQKVGLLSPDTHTVIIAALEEFLVHGLRYVFPVEPGIMTRGMATGSGATPMADEFSSDSAEIPVWPDPEGTLRGVSLTPLYRAVPAAAKEDARLYRLLAIVDSLRSGRARERKLAEELLHKEIEGYALNKSSNNQLEKIAAIKG